MISAAALTLLALRLLVQQAPPPAPSSETTDDVIARVVVLNSTFDGGAADIGAGLVVGVQGDSVLILTAAHVVLKGAAPASAIETFFPWDRRKRTQVRIVERDTRMDLAVLALDDAAAAAALREQPLLCHREPRAQEDVTIIGHRLDETWSVARGERIVNLQLGGDTRRFATTAGAVAAGNSGGPVLGGDGCFLGVVTDRDANEVRVTSAAQALAMVTGGANLMGGRSGLDRRVRRETFADVSKALNLYLFNLEALPATFKRAYLDAEELARTITAYNESYAALYHGRTAMGARLAEQFGGLVGRRYAAVMTELDAVHKSSVYIALNDAVTILRHASKLSGRQAADLKKALTALDKTLPPLRSSVDAFLSRLEPLVTNLVGER